MNKTAVILLNLGGPSKIEDVKPFLFNLFYDEAIIRLPKFFRYLIAKLISSRRTKYASEIYKKLGGKSPILELTNRQAAELNVKLIQNGIKGEVFVCMRYWNPRAEEVIEEVKKYDPDNIVLLPLYPQFSSTTSASSIKEWKKLAEKQGLIKKTTSVCCYFDDDDFINAQISAIRRKWETYINAKKRVILFSAHGLPQSVIDKGDPYQFQVEETVRSIVEKIKLQEDEYRVCYQSKVGPQKWLTPATDHLIEEYAKKGYGIMVVPIAFVSEHSETLVELDIEYAEIAHEHKALFYERIPALGTNEHFINCLLKMTKKAIESDKDVVSFTGKKMCDKKFCNCINGN